MHSLLFIQKLVLMHQTNVLIECQLSIGIFDNVMYIQNISYMYVSIILLFTELTHEILDIPC